jgi:phosphatidylserine/phosphatidylglycerophosphate/cardiolipin synthase-like enzyme
MAMASSTAAGVFSVKAYAGDAKTLVAWNYSGKKAPANLAGFTIHCQPPGHDGFYLQNKLQFETPGDHAQVATEPPTSSINAPIHKFRWLHVPGSMHQGIRPAFGKYEYTITPRFFGGQSLEPIDSSLEASITIDVKPFKKKGLELGFTRGFTQSQAFVRHFGLKALIRPKTKDLLFDTTKVSGKSPEGQAYTFDDEYEWLGFTARERILAVLNDVLADKSLRLDVFAYDLSEPTVMGILLKLAKQRRIRMILDNAALHHDTSSSKPEDQFEKLFKKAFKTKQKEEAALIRGKFGRYAHDKIFIVSDKKGATKVLTGSTNFSVTGLYVNSNHVLVFDDPKVASAYAEMFEAAFRGGAATGAFRKSPSATKTFAFSTAKTPQTEVTFSPHSEQFASDVLDKMATRIKQEGKKTGTAAGSPTGSVLFAVMEVGTGTGPVFPALTKLHADEKIFSYGISDTTNGISLYRPGAKKGVLVTGKPTKTKLPPPFDQVPGVGLGHQVHHKFVVCGFNGDDPVVFCGSSNLALKGEQVNGDNLLAIRDPDVATVFALEALALVDHFDFLDRVSEKTKKKVAKPKFASKQQEAVSAGWFLSTTDAWSKPYFDSNDLRCVDRQLFG